MAIKLRMDSMLGGAARCLGLGAILLAGIKYGAVYADTQLIVCLLLLAALILAMLRPKTRQLEGQPWLIVCMAAWLVWLVFTGLQNLPIPDSVVSALSPTTAEIRSTFGPEQQSAQSTLALLPGKASAAWAIQVVSFGCFLVGAICWRTREQRNRLFAALVVGGIVFAAWGLINRSRGTMLLLPGVEAPDRSHPFSTLIYKNAGAALLLLALATAVGCLLETLRPVIRQQLKRANRKERESGTGGFSQSARWAEPQVFLMLFTIVGLGAGIVFTLSRGIWVCAFVAILMWLASLWRLLSVKVLVGGFTLLAAAAITVMIWMGAIGGNEGAGGDQLLERASTMNLATLSSNDRFEHWSDAAESVWDFPVTGAGLGSYGYVQLVNQDVDTPRWFQHAHNMLLEFAVETGIVGLVIMAIAVLAYAMLLRRLFQRRFESTVFLTSFSVGLIAFLGLLIQSLFDFTLLTPVVAWSHALVLGVVATTGNERRRGRSIETVDQSDLETTSKAEQAAEGPVTTSIPLKTRMRRVLGRPFVWSLAAASLLLIAQSFIQREIVDDRLLSNTRVPTFNLTPSNERIADANQQLQARIDQGTSNGRIYLRKAQWDLAMYRRQLIELAKAEGQELTWLNTTPESMFQIYHRMPDENRPTALAQWKSGPQADEQITDCIQNLNESLRCNPLVPNIHLQLALLTPLSGEELDRPLQNAKALSASNGQTQFQIGLIGHNIGDDELMIDQWQRSLAYASENMGFVLQLAREKLTPEEISTKLLSRVRPNVWVSLASRSLNDSRLEPFRDAFQEGALRSIRESSMPAPRAGYLSGRVYESQGEYALAAKELEKAVDGNGVSIEYRRRYAINLWRSGSLQLAREQLVLATALQPGDRELLELLSRVERQMKTQSERQAPPKP